MINESQAKKLLELADIFADARGVAKFHEGKGWDHLDYLLESESKRSDFQEFLDELTLGKANKIKEEGKF